MKSSRKEKLAQNHINDLKMVDEIKSGNRNAYEAIYNRYYRYVQYHCYMAVKNQQLANDLAIEILTKVYLNIDKYSVKYTFNSWVTSIVKNYIVDYIRKSKNEPVNSNRNASIAVQETRDEGYENNTVYSNQLDSGYDNPEELMLKKTNHKLRREFVLNLLSGLTERERMIIIHYYFDEMSYDEIAAKLNIGLSLMKVTLLRTKEKLKNKIGSFDRISHLLAA